MKKTRLLFIAIAMTLVLALATSVVNAATITATRDTTDNTMKVGDTVTVTVKTSQPVNAAQFYLQFDNTAFKLLKVSSELGTQEEDTEIIDGNKVFVAFSNPKKTDDTITFVFEAISDKEAVPFEIVGKTKFALNPAEGESTPQVLEDEVFKAEESKVEVTVEEPKTPDTNIVDPGPSTGDNQNNEVTPPTNVVTPEPENPGSTEDPGNSGNNSGSGLVDDDGNEINRIPQTGSVMPTVIFGVVVLGIVATLAIVLVKNKKNK